MNKTVDSVETVLLENEIDTLSALITATVTLELRIKNNYFSDTIDMELGKKMDAFKRTRRRLGPLSNTFNSIRVGINEERDMLKKLKSDIENGNGDRKKYTEYVTFEQEKVDQMRSLLNAYVKEKKETMEIIDRIYPEMNAFSLSLLDKEKKKV
jgi:Mg2+ and Co2+ transporter CorA